MMKVRIIGGGSVGSTLALKLETVDSINYQIVYNSESTKAKLTELGLTTESIVSWGEADFDCDIILICVKDSQIEEVAEQLKKYTENCSPLVLHTSGAKNKEALKSLLESNYRIAAAHPYQTFAKSENDILAGTSWGVESEYNDKELIEKFISLIDGKTIHLSSKAIENRSLYHTSAVAASNFLALSVELAKNIADEAGIDWENFLPHIMKTTLINNLNEENDKPAITGPVVRGDMETVRNHVLALGESVNGVVYKNMSESLALMALDKGLIPGEKFEEIMEALG